MIRTELPSGPAAMMVSVTPNLLGHLTVHHAAMADGELAAKAFRPGAGRPEGVAMGDDAPGGRACAGRGEQGHCDHDAELHVHTTQHRVERFPAPGSCNAA